MLAGIPVVPKDDWCRGCDKGQWTIVSTVVSTGKKKQPFCKQCWQAYMPYLTSAERGDAANAANGVSSPASPSPAQVKAPYTCCKNRECAEFWRKAKHTASGYCSWSCAEANGWVPDDAPAAKRGEPSNGASSPTLPAQVKAPYTCCKNRECAELWRKAKHAASGYCSWSCAEANGWVPPSVHIAPPAELAEDAPVASDGLDIGAHSIVTPKAVEKSLGEYLAKYKDLRPVEARSTRNRHGLGYDNSSAKRPRFFQKSAEIKFVYGCTISPVVSLELLD